MKSVKVSGLLEEIGTLYEDGTLVIDNLSLIKNGFVIISEDIVRRLNAGEIMCYKNPCKRIRIDFNEEVFETTTAAFLAEGKSTQDGEPKISLHLEKWQLKTEPTTKTTNPPEIKKSLKQILIELKIDYLEAGL